MSKQNFVIPQDLLEDKTLTPSQKMILTFLKNNGANFSLNIAKGIGTRRSVIQEELNALVKQQRAFVSNGSQRAKYSLSPSFDFETSSTVVPEGKLLSSLRSKLQNNNNINKSNSSSLRSKLLSRFEAMANQAIQYWFNHGGVKHRVGSGRYKKSIELLTLLFEGKAFDLVPDSVIPNPLLNKRKKFSLEDWKTAIDNYNISLESPAHLPINKERAKAYQKKLALPTFIYNSFAKEGNTRSMFLQYLDGPKLLHTEVAIYKKLTTSLTKQFPKTNFRLKPTESQIIAVANVYGKIIKEYEWKYPSPATAASTLIEFIETKYGQRYNPNWMTAKWFKFELENYLDRQGLINIHE
jgi:hypothetical protein